MPMESTCMLFIIIMMLQCPCMQARRDSPPRSPTRQARLPFRIHTDLSARQQDRQREAPLMPMSMHTRKLVVVSVILTGLVATTDKREASWGIHSSQGCLVDASYQQLSSVLSKMLQMCLAFLLPSSPTRLVTSPSCFTDSSCPLCSATNGALKLQN